MTNREKINRMNNDDFIEFLDNRSDCQYCNYKNTECWEIDVICDDGFRKWLEQEAVESD